MSGGKPYSVVRANSGYRVVRDQKYFVVFFSVNGGRDPKLAAEDYAAFSNLQHERYGTSDDI